MSERFKPYVWGEYFLFFCLFVFFDLLVFWFFPLCMSERMKNFNALCNFNRNVQRRGRQKEKWENQSLLLSLYLFTSCPSSPAAAPRHLLAPHLIFLISSPACVYFSSSLVVSPPFDLSWHCRHLNFGQKRTRKRDRWRDESKNSRRQMEESEKMGGGGKSSRSFLPAGASYFI